MNMKYGKLIENRIEYAPNQVQIGGAMYSKPTQEQYLIAGWKKVVDVVPEYREGYEAKLKNWSETDVELIAVYEYVEVQPVAESFDISKLKLHIALASINLWEPVKSWMQSLPVELSSGEPVYAYDAYLEAQVLNTGNSLFEPYLALAKEQFKDYITSEQVDALISACRAD